MEWRNGNVDCTESCMYTHGCISSSIYLAYSSSRSSHFSTAFTVAPLLLSETALAYSRMLYTVTKSSSLSFPLFCSSIRYGMNLAKLESCESQQVSFCFQRNHTLAGRLSPSQHPTYVLPYVK